MILGIEHQFRIKQAKQYSPQSPASNTHRLAFSKELLQEGNLQGNYLTRLFRSHAGPPAATSDRNWSETRNVRNSVLIVRSEWRGSSGSGPPLLHVYITDQSHLARTDPDNTTGTNVDHPLSIESIIVRLK